MVANLRIASLRVGVANKREFALGVLFIDLLFGAAILACCGNVLGQTQARTQLHSGEVLAKQLEKRITVSWTAAEFRDTLVNLATGRGVQLFVDRRIDPGQLIEYSAKDVALGEILYEVAELADCGICWMDDLAYVGPLQEVAELSRRRGQLVDQLRRNKRMARKWLADSAWTCPKLAQPNELLKSLMDQVGGSSETQLPHDLLPEYRFSNVNKLDQLLLLSVGFDLWPQIDSASKVQLQKPPTVDEREIRIVLDRETMDETLFELKDKFPEVSFTVNRRNVTFQASALDAYQIDRTIRQVQYGVAAPTTEVGVFSLRSRVSIGGVLREVAKRLDVELKFDPSLREQLMERVDVDVHKVTAEQLIESVLQGTGLEFSLDDKSLSIKKK